MRNAQDVSQLEISTIPAKSRRRRRTLAVAPAPGPLTVASRARPRSALAKAYARVDGPGAGAHRGLGGLHGNVAVHRDEGVNHNRHRPNGLGKKAAVGRAEEEGRPRDALGGGHLTGNVCAAPDHDRLGCGERAKGDRGGEETRECESKTA